MKSVKVTSYANKENMIIGVSLTLLILLIYWDTQFFDFINYDDPTYITDNYYVKVGLTWQGLIWALQDIHTGYWHPVTWLSHMLDYQLFGARSGGHHWTSLLLHIVNTLLLFHVLAITTGERWKSAFAAALFAVHPLNVESVAWISERKNVLSAFFWLATTWAYVVYVKQPSFSRYLAVFFLFLMGLLTKPMLVTLPCVLLLMDVWPLKRYHSNDGIGKTNLLDKVAWRRLLIEKAPLFFLSVVISALTLLAVSHEQGLPSLDVIPPVNRFAHALVSYVVYLGKFVWPTNLSVFYPHPIVTPIWQAIVAGLFLLLTSWFCLWKWQQRPFLITGWLWFLGVLFPVIGIVQAGHQAFADRYVYLPYIGLYIITAWGVPVAFARFKYRKTLLKITAVFILLAFASCAWLQLRFWQNSIYLFERAISVTSRNWVAHNNLGEALLKEGRISDAIHHFQAVLKIRPDYKYAHNNLGLAFTSKGRTSEAETFYLEALRYSPNFAEAHNNIGVALSKQGRYKEAVQSIQKALYYRPVYPEALNNLGFIMAMQNRFNDAIVLFNQALRLKPDYADALINAGSALAQLGRTDEAIKSFQQALQIVPDDAMAHNNLGIALTNKGRYPEAAAQFQEAIGINPSFEEARKNFYHVQRKMKP